MASPREQFLNTLSNWEHSIPLQTQWIVRINPIGNANIDGLLANIGANTVLDKSSFKTNTDIQHMLFGEQTQPNIDGLGLFCVQKVNIPGDNFVPSEAGAEGMMGFIKGNTGGDRMSSNAKTLGLEFLETNIDFIDGIIRPWIITASYQGLLARSPQYSIKADIDIVQFTRSTNGMVRPVRKMHHYSNCVPIGVENMTLSYTQEDVHIRTINWTFTNYEYKFISPTLL